MFEGVGELVAGGVIGFGGYLVFDQLKVGGLVVGLDSL